MAQKEVLHQFLKTYLDCMAREKSTQQAKYLSLAKWWYNTIFNSTTRTRGEIKRRQTGAQAPARYFFFIT